jgi:thioredoxin-like negative regulator of GroEL
MTDQSTVSSAPGIAEQVKEAWKDHYQHRNEQALAAFEKVAAQDPEHIDAQYGLGLTLAALGQSARAAEVFKHVAQLVDVQIRQQPADDEDARYRMLARMINQQLDLLKVKQS